MAMKRTKKIKEMIPKVCSHLYVSIAATSITDADAQRTLNHKMAKRQKQPADPPAENSSAPEAEQGGAE